MYGKARGAKYEEENEARTRAGMVGAYLVRYVGYVNVIIPQILKGESSRTRRTRGERRANRGE